MAGPEGKVSSFVLQVDSPQTDLLFPINDQWNDAEEEMMLDQPSNYNTDLEYDPESGDYKYSEKYGDRIQSSPPSTMSVDDYLEYDMEQAMDNYWDEKREAERVAGSGGGFQPSLDVSSEIFDRIFGGSNIDIRPQGSAQLTFGVNSSKTENPQIPEKQRRITTFDFDQQIQLNVVGKIGDKMRLQTNYNTESQFDFQNQMKLEYTGKEDEIIKKIEAGNVSLPLQSSLISGSQSLFGVKSELQFGRLRVTSVFSQQKGEKKEIEVSGGAQTKDFDIKADEYEENKHYFLSQYFRDHYNEAMKTLPIVSSQVNITRIEVWVTNRNNTTKNTRNIVAFTDLGEGTDSTGTPYYLQDLGIQDQVAGNDLPDNEQNNIYQQVSNDQAVRGFFNASGSLMSMSDPGPFHSAEDYERVENARMLTKDEYSFNSNLGFISLNQSLDQDEVLGVAYEYTYRGETYQVGELSTDGIAGQDALVVKLLKSTNLNTRSPLWDLMMKNVYSINAYQLNKKNFELHVLYNDPQQGVDINYIPQQPIDGVPLIQVLGADRLDQNNKPNPDGMFDFVDNASTKGGTVNSRNGRIFFPVVEPFGQHLREKFEKAGVSKSVVDNIVYDPLYDSTKTAAQQIPELNRYRLRGTYQSASGSEISLNALNIPEGSVKVTAGGVELKEGVDYTVDYTLGRVKILNQGLLESQTEINVSLESNSLFSVQTKRLMGSRFDYRVSDDFNIGATVMNLTERPLTQKINIGDEPINNTIWGADFNYQTESQYITKLVDMIPLIDTKEKSSINVSGEFAQLIPGHSRAIGDEGTSYIDDFEGSQSGIDIRTINSWVLSSTPQGQNNLFPEGKYTNDKRYGYNRAKLAWYVVDPLFYRNNNITPQHIKNDPEMRSDHRMREVLENEVFPNKELPSGTPQNIAMFDLAYYPSERGPYNYDAEGSNVSAGLTEDGKLKDPESRWAGIMRKLQTTDFEASNVQYIEFWVMDPFNQDREAQTGGDLYFNLGNVSEDILRDSRKAFENGLPTGSTFDPSTLDTTEWGQVPTTQSLVNAFDNDPESREFQDVGLDGFDNENEREFFNSYLTRAGNVVNTDFSEIQDDPSGDDYTYYRDDRHDAQQRNILERYKEYNGLEGNSPTSEQSAELNDEGYPTSATTRPDAEDIDQDNNLNETESYYQYHVSLREEDMKVGQNYITDSLTAYPQTPDGETREVTWYQFKIPIRQPDKVVNGIQDFRSIRFFRMLMKNWEDPVVLRFARLELIRGEWRQYAEPLLSTGEHLQDDPEKTSFNLAAVNVEENSNRSPINYKLPPGIQREINNQTTNLAQMNEQSLVYNVCNLQDGDARAAYRNVEFDIRNYKKMKMFVHMESSNQGDPVEKGDVTLFVRLGSDFDRNYYEFEMPLTASQWGDNSTDNIWPEDNRLEIDLSALKEAKKKRNNAVAKGAISYTDVYTCDECTDGDQRIRVVGTPNLSELRTVLVGVRNPAQYGDNPWKPDDGMPKCFQVWLNELRLTDFNENGGWAATGRVNTQLADLGDVAVSGKISTPGFGGLEDKINERQREEVRKMNASSNLKLGKFFPQKSGVKIPMYLGFSQGTVTPQFDPLSPDLEFEESVESLPEDQRDERRRKSRKFTKTRSINFTNVRIDKDGQGGEKSHFYDISNFSLSYSYNERFMRDINTTYDTRKTYNGGLSYNFSPSPQPVEPFKDVGLFKRSDYFDLLRDFNFYVSPRQLSFQTTFDRSYNERLVRSNVEGVITQPRFTRNFQWNRIYDLKWDLSKNLKFSYGANNASIIGENDGRVNRKYAEDEYEQFKDSVAHYLERFGETTTFDQNMNFSYKLPLDKLPITDWINATTGYKTSYNWQRAPFSREDFGHTIQNSRTLTLQSKLNMNDLYNKVGFLKKINKGSTGRRQRPSQRQKKGKGKESEDEEDEDDKGGGVVGSILEQGAKLLMSLQNVSFNYTRNEGTLLPGYGEKTEFFGMNEGFEAPGAGFILGKQETGVFGGENSFGEFDNYADYAASQEWLKKEPDQNQKHTITRSQNFDFKATLEPLSRLRISLDASRQSSRNQSEFYRYQEDTINPGFVHDSWQETGNLSMTVNTWRTAFAQDDENDVSPVFTKMKEYRQAYSEQLGKEHSESEEMSNGYYDGYGGSAQDVVIPAFLAAYMGKKPGEVEADPFKTLPAPNWRVTYNGLTQLSFIQKYFQNVTLGHGYRSTMNISYTTNLKHEFIEGTDDPGVRDQEENWISQRQINAVTISEQFSPIFKVDMTWKNSLVSKVEWKKSRNLSFSLSNHQLSEVRSNELVIGGGYQFKDVKLPVQIMGQELKSDLKLRVDVSVRDNESITRKMVEGQNEVTSGQRVTSIKTSADYVINQRLSVRLFFDHVVNKPYVSTTFPTSNTNGGLTLRLTLAQ